MSPHQRFNFQPKQQVFPASHQNLFRKSIEGLQSITQPIGFYSVAIEAEKDAL
jgi:hypothetical protein